MKMKTALGHIKNTAVHEGCLREVTKTAQATDYTTDEQNVKPWEKLEGGM